jgi:activator of HSP90 ATPase
MKRYLVLGMAFVASMTTMISTLDAQTGSAEHPSAMTPSNAITIHQEVDFTASPARLYEALLDAKQFAAFSGRAAKIDRKPGGACDLFDGHIIARNVELVPNQRVVQAWRPADWPAGVWSIVRFELHANGTGTHLVFDHIGFPEGAHDHLSSGWDQNYWSLLKKYLK